MPNRVRDLAGSMGFASASLDNALEALRFIAWFSMDTSDESQAIAYPSVIVERIWDWKADVAQNGGHTAGRGAASVAM